MPSASIMDSVVVSVWPCMVMLHSRLVTSVISVMYPMSQLSWFCALDKMFLEVVFQALCRTKQIQSPLSGGFALLSLFFVVMMS